ncbi:hypothetical protein AGMMS49928_08570 [Spirochaetia bacterium]|nr:hypothetical protein AGMMS49928_08570 [Spirochaetia bacterium]
MEELRSTEILDREILEDARKKAFKILKTADDTVKAAAARWEKKIKRAATDIEKKYAGRLEKTRIEVMARLPLDKRRARSEKIEAMLRDAAAKTFAGFSREKLLAIVEDELRLRLDFCREEGELENALKADSSPEFFYLNMDEDEAQAIFGKLLGKAYAPAKPGKIALKKANTTGSNNTFPLMGINSRTLRITASIEDAAETLLQDKRAEMLEALLAGEGKDD